jgi:hypothetical protein
MRCPQFRQCGQYAMLVPLDSSFDVDRGDRASIAAVVPPS